MFRRSLTVFFALALLLSMAGCQPATQQPAAPQPAAPSATSASAAQPAAAKPSSFRVAMVLNGAINDKSFNEGGYNALQTVKKELSADVAFQEKVPLSNAEEAMRTFAAQGYDLVIGWGDQFSDAGKIVAPEFPKVKFAVVNGANTAANLASVATFDEQVTYLAGLVAAKVSKSGKIGFIGGLEIPPVARNGNGFEKGAKSVNPNITVVKSVIGDFNDANKGKEATLAMADQGVDVIYYYVDNAMLGIQDAARSKKIKLIGCIFDQHDIAPDLIITSAIQDAGKAVLQTAKSVKDGSFQGKAMIYGLDTGSVGLAPFRGSVPADVEEAVKKAQQDIISGAIKVPRT